MRKNIFTAVALWLVACAAAVAEDYSKYYQNLPTQVKQVVAVSIPSNTISLKDVGGVGDGLTLNTEAFQKGINQLSKQGGGRLDVPAGVWLTGPIKMKSNIELHLDKNAIILMSPDKQLFVDPAGKSSRVLPGIKASKCQNIAITGDGIIDGNGAQWRPVKRNKVSDTEWKRFKALGGIEKDGGKLWYPWKSKLGYADIADTPEKQEKMRQDLVRLTDCENVLIQGVTIQNSPHFHLHPCTSKNVIIDGVTVRCPWNAQNGDAIDITDCQQVLIVNSTVDAGDDGLCMKSGKPKDTNLVNGCEDILIDSNTVFHAHGGFVIGSEAISGMKRIVVRNCRFSGTDTGLRFKSAIGRGGKTEAIYINNIVMNDIANEAIVFECGYEDRAAGGVGATANDSKTEFVPEFTDIHISNVTCRGAKVAISAHGIAGKDCVHGINIKNSTIVYNQTAIDIDEQTAKIDMDGMKITREK